MIRCTTVSCGQSGTALSALVARFGGLLLVAIALILPSSSLASGAPESTARPNILVLVAQDMGPRVGMFGDAVAVTPSLDHLARQGVRYLNTFSRSHSDADTQNPLRKSAFHPRKLSDIGYYTFTNESLGYTEPVSDKWNRIESSPTYPSWNHRIPGQPFFGVISLELTHRSGVLPPLGSQLPSVGTLIEQLTRWWRLGGAAPAVLQPEDIVLPARLSESSALRDAMVRHYSNIALMDAQVGEILRQLRADKLLQSTIVVWLSDEGDPVSFVAPGWFDIGLPVPLIIRWPDHLLPRYSVPGGVSENVITLEDVVPVLLEMAGVASPDAAWECEGAQRERLSRPYLAYRELKEDGSRMVVRDAHYKYVVVDQPASSTREHLYEIRRDPQALIDIASEPSQAGVLSRMRARARRQPGDCALD